MINQRDEIRIRNPFLDPMVTELIEDPERYHKVFSERILVGETLQVFQPANIILTGPQGSGKSMVLNLIRHGVLSKWLADNGAPPEPLEHIPPFLGISINLVRASFHVFGRRSVSKIIGGQDDPGLDATCAADYLTHYLFREFLKAIDFLTSREGNRFRDWLQISRQDLQDHIRTMGQWDSWFGYYSDCTSLPDLLEKCEKRLLVWREFLNANIESIPANVWETKASMEDALHSMGNLLRKIGPKKRRVSLFVVIDQYEVLPELNPTYGTTLQRIINSLIKARDPVVFYKIGARTYDWGRELRIWGAESRIEEQRDYAVVNLSTVLVRGEDAKGWLFPDFARDVAYKRMKEQGFDNVIEDQIELILGPWTPNHEAKIYFGEKNQSRKYSVLLPRVSTRLRNRIKELCEPTASPLELRLAGGWVLQRQQRGLSEDEICDELSDRPWLRLSWRKERVGVALLQIASLANQRKRYFGWETVVYLSGANITAFLMLCGEIWDMAAKLGVDILKDFPLTPIVQSDGIFIASRKWANRDRVEHIGGNKRFAVLSRLGPAIRETVVGDSAMSNPGHSGFSLRESELYENDKGTKVAKFLEDAVNWALFEERPHTSKQQKENATRRKWYLCALMAPFFGIPYIRVKEPLYVTIDEVYDWIFKGDKIVFRRSRSRFGNEDTNKAKQLEFLLEDIV